MIGALIQGTLAGDPVERKTSSGGVFWTANARVPAGADVLFIGLATFDETAGARLMQLAKGASVAAAGTLESNTWTARDGSERQGWRLTANEILSVYQARKRARRGDDEGDNDDR